MSTETFDLAKRTWRVRCPVSVTVGGAIKPYIKREVDVSLTYLLLKHIDSS